MVFSNFFQNIYFPLTYGHQRLYQAQKYTHWYSFINDLFVTSVFNKTNYFNKNNNF